ncbi:hypothetical protein [Gelidibacter mesophilus]|uniref:hypothetical protein n=1 Tax=Gelidibacter mesophilus TaxID=169050 RepID=UPI000485F389|nr:hypothetical protein [Gelidibacter mesophilus]
MTDLLRFDFCDIHIYEDYMIVIINEGLTVLPKHNNLLKEVVEVFFYKKDFVYITHRINSYAVDPTTYIETSKIKNLKGFAVVSKDFKAKSNAEIEKLFLHNKPFEIFHDLQDAVSWTRSILDH